MPSLESLPDEILYTILGFVGAKKNLLNTRLASRRLERVAVEYAFETITLYGHWEDLYGGGYCRDSGGDGVDVWAHLAGYDAQSFLNILDSESLRRFVKKAIIYTCSNDCNAVPDCEGNFRYTGLGLTNTWSKCITRLREIPNLRAIEVFFDRQASGVSDPKYAFQRDLDRSKRFREVLSAVDGRITELAIRHYANGQDHIPIDVDSVDYFDEEELQNSPDVQTGKLLLERNLKNLTSLRLSIIHDECRDESSSLRDGNAHAFWIRFPSLFLTPTQQTLTKLALYSDLRIGFFPKLDLAAVHFPKLRALTLGHFVFFREQQVDWIASHKASLRELYLDHCSILYEIGYATDAWFDEDGYPKDDPAGSGDYGHGATEKVKLIGLRWSHVFARLAAEMTGLEDFVFGSSTQWEFDTPSVYADDVYEGEAQRGPGMPIMPWNAETRMENELHAETYLIYDDAAERYRTAWTPGEMPPLQGAALDDDEAALQALTLHLQTKPWTQTTDNQTTSTNHL